MGKYQIKDLENLSGIKAHTIRAWESRYKLWEPERTTTNIRLYNDEHLKQLLNIALLLQNGYKISKISQLSDEHVHEAVENIFQQELEADQVYEAPINGMVVAMIELNEEMFERIFSNIVLRIGFQNTILKVVYPFLNKVGMMWGTSQVNPAQEHFVSNLIRQKLIVAIDGQTVKPDPNDCYVLFLPEGELHEIGLLLSAYILKTNGKKVIYLGQNVPFSDLKRVCDICKPHKLFTLLISPGSFESRKAFVELITNSFPERQLLVAGNMSQFSGMELPKQVKLIESVDALIEYVA